MKILLTGEKSKIGLAFIKYMKEHYTDDDYAITSMSVRGDAWEKVDFSQYDVVLHCAGIFNAPAQEYAYYDEINVQLTEKLFLKSLEDNVKHFIYLSTMDIYNMQKDGCVKKDTVPEPISLYGKSKLEAENKIRKLAEEKDIVLSIIRCCPVIGNNAETKMEGYMKAFKFPIFPLMFTDDKRSILHVDTLCELLKMIIDNTAAGIFFPQNLQPLSVTDILKTIKVASKKKTILIRLPKFMWINLPMFRKIYGNSYYDTELSNHFNNDYVKMDSKEAIQSLFL